MFTDDEHAAVVRCLLAIRLVLTPEDTALINSAIRKLVEAGDRLVS